MWLDTPFKNKHQLHFGDMNSLSDDIKKLIIEASAETKKKNYRAAASIYKKIIPDYPDLEILRNNFGCCLAGLEKFDDAETELIEAIRITKVNRDQGKSVPRSFPEEPTRNLIKLYKTILSRADKIPIDREPPQRQVSVRLNFIKEYFRRIINSIKRKGILVVLKRIPTYLHVRLHPVIRWHDKVFALRAEQFDRMNNIDTAGIIYQTDLMMESKNQLHAVYYQGSDTLLFNNALSSLKIDFAKYVFIDFGSGKGKALFLASGYSFKKIIGIEFSEVLHTAARKNISQFNKENIEAYCMDVVDYEIPREPVVCYFYDPFDEYIMAEVVHNINKAYNSYKRNIIIIYNIARFSHLFDAQPWLERLRHIGAVMIWSTKETDSGT